MDKGLYELKINEALEHVMPPLQEMELELLTQSLLNEGCRDPLVVWKETGELVDGHNRYRICQENDVPFEYVEMSFENEVAARHWIIKNQLARRNVPDFVRCELVLPLEAELKAEAKKRQIRKPADSEVPNLAQQNNGKTRDELAQMAGVSHGTMDKAKKLAESADEETKEKLRNGDLSIHGAYTAMKNKEEPSGLKPKETPAPDSSRAATWGDIIPGCLGVAEILAHSDLPRGYTPPPDTALDITPINADGTDPADDLECEESLDMDQTESFLSKELEKYERRVMLIFSKMATPSAEEIQTLNEMIDSSYKRVKEQLTSIEKEKRL